jgi:hypothetical protein
MRKIHPVARADLDHATRETGKQLVAMLPNLTLL